jgi:peptidoglycan pentaglycine glycine transferase (the first glycine)
MASSLDVLWTHSLGGADAEAFDRFVADAAGGHYAQTRAWEPVARATRPCTVRYFLARDGARVVGAALVQKTSLGPLALPFAAVDRGPVLADVDDAPRVLDALARAARRRGIVRLTVMPYWADEAADRVTRDLRAARFRDVQALDGAHTSTLRLDLEGKTDEALFAGKAREQVRYGVRQAEKAGARARPGTRVDVEEHQRLYGEQMGAQGRGKSLAWYEALWSAMLTDPARGGFFVCEHEGRVVGTVVVLRHGRQVTYVYGATSANPPRLPKTVLPLTLAIRWARDQGAAVFDLGGVPSEEDGDPKRVAIAKFKLDFSKTRVKLVREHARWF